MGCATLSPVDALLDALPFPAAVVGRGDEAVASNLLFQSEFGGGAGSAWLAALEVRGQADELRAALHRLTDRSDRPGESIRFPAARGGTGRRWLVHLRRLRYEAKEHALVVFEPLLANEPLRARLHDLENSVEALRRMKHEISNPLMGLLGNAELLASDASLEPQSKRKALAILEQARRMCDQIAAASYTVDMDSRP